MKYCVYETINLINGKYYRGFCNNYKRVEAEHYRGSGTVLWRAINKYGYESFVTYVVKRFKTAEEAFAFEKEYVIPHSVDPMSYNVNKGGHGSWHASILAAKDTQYMYDPESMDEIRVKKHDILKYKRKGWKIGAPSRRGSVTINNGEISTRVKLEELKEYTDIGWNVGYVPGTYPRGYRVVYDIENDSFLYVQPADLHLYKDNPKFKIGNNSNGTTGYRSIKNVELGLCKMLHIDKAEAYLEDGWVFGSFQVSETKDKIAMHIPGTYETIWIYETDINTYIDHGYEFGTHMKDKRRKERRTKGRKNVYKKTDNGYITKLLDVEDIGEYLSYGWSLGGSPDISERASNSIWVHMPNTTIESFVHNSNINDYKQRGYVFGRGINTNAGKIWMNHPELGRKKINEIEEETYLHLGYVRSMGDVSNINRAGVHKAAVWMHDPETNQQAFVQSDQVDEYLSIGYVKGCSSKHREKYRGSINISKVEENGDVKVKQVHKDEVDSYLADGWIKGNKKKSGIVSKTKGNRWMHHPENNATKLVEKSEMYDLANDGWIPGLGDTRKKDGEDRANKGSKWIHNLETNERKCVQPEQLDQYLEQGWKIGFGLGSTNGAKWIHNPVTEQRKCVKKHELDQYLSDGWQLGSGRTGQKK